MSVSRIVHPTLHTGTKGGDSFIHGNKVLFTNFGSPSVSREYISHSQSCEFNSITNLYSSFARALRLYIFLVKGKMFAVLKFYQSKALIIRPGYRSIYLLQFQVKQLGINENSIQMPLMTSIDLAVSLWLTHDISHELICVLSGE